MKRVLTGLALVLCVGAVAAPAQAAFPGQNGKLALSLSEQDRGPENGTTLAFVQPDGSGLTERYGTGMEPMWSPDGTRLVIQSVEFGYTRIYSASGVFLGDSLGSGGEETARRPVSWFPDGKRLLMDRAIQTSEPPPDAGQKLWVGPAEGPFTFWDDAPVQQRAMLSPDGTRLAYVRDGALRVVGIDGSDDRFVAQPASDDLDWSPDGQSIVYSGERFGSTGLYVVAAAGGAPRLLTSGPHYDRDPAWSPDGTRIAFVTGAPFEREAWSVPSTGGERVQITQSPERFTVWHIDWQPLPGTQPPRVNRPPMCGAVKVSPSTLTHRAGRLGQVTIGGAVDPDGSGLAWKITGVTQDEAVGWSRAGAVRTQWSRTVALRRDRLPWSDGRVYAISFRVTDWQGAACTGTVKVGVPNGDRPARDSGQRFDSFTGAPLPRR